MPHPSHCNTRTRTHQTLQQPIVSLDGLLRVLYVLPPHPSLPQPRARDQSMAYDRAKLELEISVSCHVEGCVLSKILVFVVTRFFLQCARFQFDLGKQNRPSTELHHTHALQRSCWPITDEMSRCCCCRFHAQLVTLLLSLLVWLQRNTTLASVLGCVEWGGWDRQGAWCDTPPFRDGR